jgi:hypothetical protein
MKAAQAFPESIEKREGEGVPKIRVTQQNGERPAAYG